MWISVVGGGSRGIDAGGSNGGAGGGQEGFARAKKSIRLVTFHLKLRTGLGIRLESG